MNARSFYRSGDDARALWFSALLTFVLGCYLIETKYQRAIAGAHGTTEALYNQTVANERTVAQASSLRRLQQRALTDLRQISVDRPLWATTAQLLVTLENSAGKYDVAVVGVEPGQAQASSPTAEPNGAAQRTSTDRWLLQTDVGIRVRGRFRNVLRFIENLSHERTLIRAGDTELALARAGDRSDEPVLAATIHATLYRVQLPHGEERVATTR